MERRSMNALAVPAGLLIFSSIPIGIAVVEIVQIPLDLLPEDSRHLRGVPVRHFAHVVAGVLFGLLGPLQFGRVLAGRFGRLHRITGRIFVAAGALLALSSLALIWELPHSTTPLVTGARLVFGLALAAALWQAMATIRVRNIVRHRAWMIRAYALGIGATAVSFIMFPIYIATGAPPSGLLSDLLFVGAWIGTLLVAEVLIRRRRVQIPA